MNFERGRLVHVHLVRYKKIAFFCGDCGGTGIKGVSNCNKCNGECIQVESLRYLVYGGIGRVQGVFSLNGVTTYTIVMPTMQGTENDPKRTANIALAYWNRCKNSDTLLNSMTVQVPGRLVFAKFGEAMTALPEESRRTIEEGIRKFGGVAGTYTEDVESLTSLKNKQSGDQKPKSPDKVGNPNYWKHKAVRTGDHMWAVEYQSQVTKTFQCKKCEGLTARCSECYGSGFVYRQMPQYIIRGLVRINRVNGPNFVGVDVPKIEYFDDHNQIRNSKIFWDNMGAGKEKRGVTFVAFEWNHIFFSLEATQDWIREKNNYLMRVWSEKYKLLPVNSEGEPLPEFKDLETRFSSDGPGSDKEKFPKDVPIESCLC